ncbi:MAG: hypothetical protein ACE5EQ_10235 [Phycisphaerae bacterium]
MKRVSQYNIDLNPQDGFKKNCADENYQTSANRQRSPTARKPEADGQCGLHHGKSALRADSITSQGMKVVAAADTFQIGFDSLGIDGGFFTFSTFFKHGDDPHSLSLQS